MSDVIKDLFVTDGTIVTCGMCGSKYMHPKDAAAGYGKCSECFFKMVDATVAMAREWAAENDVEVEGEGENA